MFSFRLGHSSHPTIQALQPGSEQKNWFIAHSSAERVTPLAAGVRPLRGDAGHSGHFAFGPELVISRLHLGENFRIAGIVVAAFHFLRAFFEIE